MKARNCQWRRNPWLALVASYHKSWELEIRVSPKNKTNDGWNGRFIHKHFPSASRPTQHRIPDGNNSNSVSLFGSVSIHTSKGLMPELRSNVFCTAIEFNQRVVLSRLLYLSLCRTVAVYLHAESYAVVSSCLVLSVTMTVCIINHPNCHLLPNCRQPPPNQT